MANPINVKIVGQALNSRGFTAEQTVSGVGLNTFGFLWPTSDIWTPADPAVTTAWADCSNCTDGDE